MTSVTSLPPPPLYILNTITTLPFGQNRMFNHPSPLKSPLDPFNVEDT